jgi:LysR family transcriptional regulator, flagellar master operon regulator
MEIEFARTFLAVAAAGNFVAAAEHLHVTQSTVSARIQTLETQLGVRLFSRGRGGAELTPAGQRFLRHAKTLVRTLEQARHDMGLPDGFQGSLTLSGRIALWEGFLPRWAGWMRRTAPEVALRLEIGFEEGIMQGLVQGTLDVGVLYTPERRPGLGIERLFDETLVLAGTDPACPWPDPGYVQVDWGPEFYAQFSAAFPHNPPPALHANIGWLGLQWMAANSGSAYLPRRMLRDALEQGRLIAIPKAPSFLITAYMVYPLDRRQDPLLEQALEGLRRLGAEERRRD